MDPTKREQFHRAATDIMLNREFIPNTPCRVNACRHDGTARRLFRPWRTGLPRRNNGPRPHYGH